MLELPGLSCRISEVGPPICPLASSVCPLQFSPIHLTYCCLILLEYSSAAITIPL